MSQVFISYTHRDNRVAPGVPRGWVDHLHSYLEVRLEQILGFSPALWRDKEAIRGNQKLRETIAQGLSNTDILLSVLSPLYLNSEWCRTEWENFLQQAELDRLFKVVKTPVELLELPASMRESLWYQFFADDPDTKRFREFDHTLGPNGEKKDQRFWDKFEDLAQDMATLLKAMHGVPTPAAGPTIFLAETTSDLTEQRDKVRRELQQNRHGILPDKPLPTNKPQLEYSVRDWLHRSQLSVHLIGAHYGFVPDQELERSAIWMQEELAREHGKSTHFPRLIWLPPGLEPKDDRQRRFIETLHNACESTNGSDMIQTKIEDLKTIIEEKLKPPSNPVPTPPPEDGVKRVYLLYDERDEDATTELYDYLYDEGCEVLRPEFNEKAMEADKQHMLDCDAVLIYYASMMEMSVTTRLRNLTGFGRTRPLSAVGVLVTGERNTRKEGFRSRDAIVMKNFGDFDPKTLNEFMQRLNLRNGGAQ